MESPKSRDKIKISTLNKKLYLEKLRRIPDNIGGYSEEWESISDSIWGSIEAKDTKLKIVNQNKKTRSINYLIIVRYQSISKFIISPNFFQEIRVRHETSIYSIKSFFEIDKIFVAIEALKI